MLKQNNENLSSDENRALISGKFTDEFNYSHNTNGQDFYKNTLEVTEEDGKKCYVTIVTTEQLVCKIIISKGKYAFISGKVQTLEKVIEKQKLTKDVIIFAKQIEFCEERSNNRNSIYLEGIINTGPIIPKAHKYTRELWLMVKENNENTEIVPCKFYGTETKNAKMLSKGTKIQLEGKIECRNKLKLLEDGSIEIIPINNIVVLRFSVVK